MVSFAKNNKIIIKNEELSNIELIELGDQLDEFLFDAGKIVGYDVGDIKETIKKLLSTKNTKAKILANDILDVQNEISTIEESLIEEIDDNNPFLSLYNEDEDTTL